MIGRYLVLFLFGWSFNFALDANLVAREALSWLQNGWLGSFYESGQASPAHNKRK